MTACKDFFEKLDKECESAGSKIRAERVRAERHARLIEWENETASSLSPGPVAAGERIRKALFQGREIVDGLLHRNTFISLDGVGFSADRMSHTTADGCKERFAKLAKAHQPLYGYIDVDVDDLRARHCKAENDPKATSMRAIAVYDTAIEGNTAHAEAFMIVKYSNKKPFDSLKADLMEKYQPGIKAY